MSERSLGLSDEAGQRMQDELQQVSSAMIGLNGEVEGLKQSFSGLATDVGAVQKSLGDVQGQIGQLAASSLEQTGLLKEMMQAMAGSVVPAPQQPGVAQQPESVPAARVIVQQQQQHVSAPALPPAAAAAAAAGSSAAHVPVATLPQQVPVAPVLAPGPSYAAVTNSNVERLQPGVTANANAILAGGAIPVTSFQASSALPGMEGPAFPSMNMVRTARHGGFGSVRSVNRVMLVEQFVNVGVSGLVQVSEVMDPATGRLQKNVSQKLLSDGQLLEAMPSQVQWEEGHDQMGNQMVSQRYVTLEEFWPYLAFLSNLADAFDSLTAADPKGWLAAMHFDRRCRIAQWRYGYPWSHAFRLTFFVEAYVQAKLSVVAPPRRPLGPAAPSAPRAWRPSVRQFCYAFGRTGHCQLGDTCQYATTHHCLRCQRAEHGWEQCRPNEGGNQA